jgi:two-component system cell cycle response regulator
MNPKVLIVDDSEMIRAIVAHALESFECELLQAPDGVQGLALASRERPDVILLDISMPVMDGIELLQRLKSDRELRSVPVIMLTSEASRNTVLRIAKLGVQDYIVKPFDEAQVVRRLETLTHLKPRRGFVVSKKQFDDPLDVLLVEDKPAICEQVITGLAVTKWQVEAHGSVVVAWERILRRPPDVLLVSTSLADRGGFWLLETVQKQLKTSRPPAAFAVSVKTAVQEHALAQRLGVVGIITKPIDFVDLQTAIARALNLDVSGKFFEMQGGVLAINIAPDFNAAIAYDIAANLEAKLTEAVDIGLNTLIVDLSRVEELELDLVRLCASVQKHAGELSVRMGVIASEHIRLASKNCQEAKDWVIADSREAVLDLLNRARSTSARHRKQTPHVGHS